MIFIPVASLFMSEAQAQRGSGWSRHTHPVLLGGGEMEQSGDPECQGHSQANSR